MPNRRRRKLSTAMSAVAALAVASPCAYFLVYESTAGSKPPEHHEFKQAAVMSDLPGELMGALSQGLSQFGINLPPVPALNGGADQHSGPDQPRAGHSGTGHAGTDESGPDDSGLDEPGPDQPRSDEPRSDEPRSDEPGSGEPGPDAHDAGAHRARRAADHPGCRCGNPGCGAQPGAFQPRADQPDRDRARHWAVPLRLQGEVPITAPASLDPGADGTYPILGDPSTLGGGSPIGGGTGLGGGGGS